MSHQAEINRLIVAKIKQADTDQNVKDFLLEILNYEGRTANLEKVRYTDEYLKLIEGYSRGSKG